MMARGVAERVFPGAVLALWKEGRIWLEAFGWRAWIPKLEANHPETIYDLASLTKPLATTLCLMRLISEGTLSLESRPADYFEAPPWFREVRLFHLLSHSAGFPAHRPYFAKLITHSFEDRSQLLEDWILAEPPAYPVGKKQIYSDLGFFLLGQLITKVSGKRLDLYFEETLELLFKEKRPELMFTPRRQGIHVSRLAPTEICPWRGKLLRGEVHDENTWVIGGVAGQAGLFGSAEAVLALLERFLLAYLGEKTSFLTRDLVQTFWEWQDEAGTWALGFDRPSPEGSSAGSLISRKALGHLGFTGTSFWIDLEKAMIVVLLTNRVHPTRENTKIKAFRPALHDLIYREYA